MYSPSKDKFQNIQVGLSLSWCNGWMRTTMCRWNFFIVPMLGIKKIRYYIIFFFLDKFCYILNSMIPIKKLKNSASSNNNKMIPSFYIQNIFCRAQCLTFFSPLAYSILTHCMSPRAYLIEKKLKNSSLLFFFAVPKEYRTFQLFKQCRRCIHSIDTVLRSIAKTWMSRSWNLETIHEKICQDCGQSHNCLFWSAEEWLS